MMPPLLLCLLVATARADLSLVQTVQSQSSRGTDGLFGKTWVEVSGRRMRIVSGFAQKLPSEPAKNISAPVRIIQILDLDTTALLLIEPQTKSFVSRPLSDVRYADSLHRHTPPGQPSFSILRSTVTLREGSLRKKILDAECRHFRILAAFKLRSPSGEDEDARMTQDVWVAPVSGSLQKGLLDLIAFEAAYRKLTGAAFTPLDHETYQIREAAEYLGAPPAEVESILGQVKIAFTDIPGYALSSSVSWWRSRRAAEAAPQQRLARPKPMPAKTLKAFPWFYPVRRSFKPIRWGKPWRVIDSMLERPGRRPRFSKFESRLTGTLKELEEQEPPGRPPEDRNAPFYEIFAEMEEFEFRPDIPAAHFRPPPGYSAAPR